MDKFTLNSIPTVYDTEALSTYELVSRLSKNVGECIDIVNNAGDTIVKPYLSDIKSELAKMQSEIDKIKVGEYSDYYIKVLQAYINANLQELVSRIVKFVTFGLDDKGHFIAIIPQSWQFIQFDTNLDTNSADYGKLILKY